MALANRPGQPCFCYEIRLARPEDASPDDFFGDDLTVSVDREVVVLTGRLDQAGLHGVLERSRALRWQVLDVRRTRVDPAGDAAAPDTYEIRVVGALGAAGRSAFADLDVDREPVSTVLSGAMTQVELHRVLDQVRDLGLELVDVTLRTHPDRMIR